MVIRLIARTLRARGARQIRYEVSLRAKIAPSCPDSARTLLAPDMTNNVVHALLVAPSRSTARSATIDASCGNRTHRSGMCGTRSRDRRLDRHDVRRSASRPEQLVECFALERLMLEQRRV